MRRKHNHLDCRKDRRDELAALVVANDAAGTNRMAALAYVPGNYLLDRIHYTGWVVVHAVVAEMYGHDRKGVPVTCAVGVVASADVERTCEACFEAVGDGRRFGFEERHAGQVFHVPAANAAVHIPLEQPAQCNYDSDEKARMKHAYRQAIGVPHPGMSRVHSWPYW